MDSSIATAEPSKKARRTYGRKKDTSDADQRVGAPPAASLASRRLFLDLPTELEGDNDSFLSEGKNVSDPFGLREKLDAIDKEYDEDLHIGVPVKPSLDKPRATYNNTSPISPDVDLSSTQEVSLQSIFEDPIGLMETQSPSIAKLNKSMKATSIRAADALGSQTSTSSQAYASQISDSPKLQASSTPLTSENENEISKPNQHDFAEKATTKRVRKTAAVSSSDKSKPGSVKKLTKKEEKESKKAHARLMADQKVTVAKKVGQFSISQFLGKIENQTNGTSSDPIQDFTSSPGTKLTILNEVEDLHAGPSKLRDVSDDDLPDAADVIKMQERERKSGELSTQRKKELLALKERALRKREMNNFDSDSDDLEFVEGPVPEGDKQKPRIVSNYEKKLSSIAGFSMGKRSSVRQDLDNSQGKAYLEYAAKPTFNRERNGKSSANVDHRTLKSAMLAKASKQSHKVTLEKEEEWVKNGGKLVKRQRTTAEQLSIAEIAKTLADKKKEATSQESSALGSDSDSDYHEDDAADNASNDGTENGNEPGIVEAGLSVNSGEETDAEDHVRSLKVRTTKQVKRTMITDSDDEDGPELAPTVLIPETSMIIQDSDQQENRSINEVETDEENKENDYRYLYHGGDDKENLMLNPSSPIGLLRQRKSGVASPLSLSPQQLFVQKRQPLQSKILDDAEDLGAFSPKDPANVGLESPTRTYTPALLTTAGGFSQLFEDDGSAPSRSSASSTSALQPAFLLHPSPREKYASRSASRIGTPRKQNKTSFGGVLRNLDGDELSLTLDTRLEPALDINTQVRQKANTIFEKEQQFLLEEASDIGLPEKQDLYVTDSGLLTQTRPDGVTPKTRRILKPLASPAGGILGTSGAEVKRQPLGTLSFDSLPSSPRLRRLVKGKEIEPGFINPDNHLLPGLKPNAFDKLRKGAEKEREQGRRRLGKTEYIEGEAQESDDDEMFGFGPVVKEVEDDSEDEDPNAVVEGLVDDAQLSAEQLAEDKVLEKAKEQAEAEDEALQKYHQAAVEGKYRIKRHGGGLALEDSDSDEDEDDETRRARRRMYKKRRIEGDTLEALAKNEKTRAFYDAYQRDVQEEDIDDFVHLNEEDMEDDEGGENEPPEIVATSEIQAKLREAAREHKGKEQQSVFDPENINWTEPTASSDEEFDVKEIDNKPKTLIARRSAFGQTDNSQYDDILTKHSDSWNEQQLANWRKEQGSRRFDTGGTRGAITVTGRKKAESTRQGVTGNTRETSTKRSLGKASSILAKVSDRQNRFG